MFLSGLIRLVEKPILRETDNKVAVCSFVGVFNERRKTQDKYVDDPHFLDFVIWDKAAEFVCNRFDKGDRIYIESATPRQRKWEDDQGKKHSKIVFRINSFVKVDSPRRENQQQVIE